MPSTSNPLTKPLSRLALRYAQSPVPRFLRWWGGELLACLPQGWRQRFQVSDRSIQLRIEADGLVVCAARGALVDELGRLELEPPEALPGLLNELLDENQRSLRRILLVPAVSVLRRNLHLPVAALENLSSVLGFELDRQTPFRADQVRYDSRVLPHSADARQVPVQLALITRERLAQELTRLDGLASSLGAVDVAEDDGRRAGFNFLPAEQRARRNHSFAWMMAGMAAFTVFLMWLAMSQMIANRRDAVERLQADVEAQRAEARAVLQLRDELDSAAAGANFLAVEKASQPSMLLVLDELTRLLPDDTYLERLSASRGELTLAGQSSQAPQLVKVLQEAKSFRGAALSGPIQPDARSGKDRFNLAAKFGIEAEDGDAPAARR